MLLVSSKWCAGEQPPDALASLPWLLEFFPERESSTDSPVRKLLQPVQAHPALGGTGGAFWGEIAAARLLGNLTWLLPSPALSLGKKAVVNQINLNFFFRENECLRAPAVV